MSAKLRVLMLCWLICVHPPMAERHMTVLEVDESRTSKYNQTFAKTDEAEPVGMILGVVGLIHSVFGIYAKHLDTQKSHSLVNHVVIGTKNLCDDIEQFKRGVLDQALATLKTERVRKDEEWRALGAELRLIDRAFADALDHEAGPSEQQVAKEKAVAHTLSERHRWQGIQIGLGCAEKYIQDKEEETYKQGQTSSLLEKKGVSVLALVGFTLMVVGIIQNRATKWTSTLPDQMNEKDYLVSQGHRISDLKNVLRNRMRPWRCSFTKLEQAYIMWVVRSTTDAFTREHGAKIEAFRKEIQTYGLPAPASWNKPLHLLDLSDVFTQAVVYNDQRGAQGIYKWDRPNFMFWASRGDLFCNEELKCLQGANSVDDATWNSVKNNERGHCRAGNWWVLCPLAKNSPFASVIPAFGDCLYEYGKIGESNENVVDGRGYLGVAREGDDLEWCQQEEDVWFKRLHDGIGKDC